MYHFKTDEVIGFIKKMPSINIYLSPIVDKYYNEKAKDIKLTKVDFIIQVLNEHAEKNR